MQNFMGMDGFIWFTGVVEDRDDPSKLGRVRVRCIGYHTEDKTKIPTADLPWAHVMHPVTDPSMNGMGQTPSFMVEGTWVVGFFMDAEDKQQPVIIGTLPGVPDESPNTSKGFYDPTGTYPKSDFLNESDVNRLARADGIGDVHKMISAKENFAESFKKIETAQSDNFALPFDNSLLNTIYPYNHVYESESGHVKEFDDTYNEERIGEYHRRGTYYEITAGGDKIVHVKGSNYEFVAGSTYINVKGDVNLTVDGNFETLVKGNYNIRAKNLNIEVEQDMDTLVHRDTTEQYGYGENGGIFKTTALGAVSQRYNTTFDGVYKDAVTLTYGDKLDSSIKGAVTERYGSTIDRRIDGIQTEIYGSTVNLTTEGSFNIDSEISFNVNALTVDLDATTVDIDGTTSNINSTTTSINASTTLNLFGTTTNIDATTLDIDASNTATIKSDISTISGTTTTSILGATVGIDGNIVDIDANTFALDAPADSTNVATTSAGAAGHGTTVSVTSPTSVSATSATGATVESPDTPESELKVTEIIDVSVDEQVKAQSSDRTGEAGTGNYNPNPEFDYPLPAIILRALEEQRKSEVDGTGIDTSDMNKSEVHQTHKDVITDKVQDYYPDLKDTPEGEEQINEGNPPTSLEPNETSNIPITVGASGVPQQQYREYLGIPTKDKPTFVKPNLHKFYPTVLTEITDEIRERFPNRYFPKEILYTADDQEVVRGVKKIGQVKQEGYRIVQLRGLPRLKIEVGNTVTLSPPTDAESAIKYAKVLSIAEQVAFDMGRQLTVVSAYRSPRNNELARGVSGSRHMRGEAMDIRVTEMDDEERIDFVRLCATYGALAFGFYEGKRRKHFIHFDIYKKRHWGRIPGRYISVLRQFKLSPYKRG